MNDYLTAEQMAPFDALFQLLEEEHMVEKSVRVLEAKKNAEGERPQEASGQAPSTEEQELELLKKKVEGGVY